MEYLEGGNLAELVKAKGSLSERRTREVFVKILDAIDYCHSQKIVHRDLKLENILYSSKTNQIKIIDFGICGLFEEVSKAGTLRYCPPEVGIELIKIKLVSGSNLENLPTIDIWAMGIILYKITNGRFPFTGEKKL